MTDVQPEGSPWVVPAPSTDDVGDPIPLRPAGPERQGAVPPAGSPDGGSIADPVPELRDVDSKGRLSPRWRNRLEFVGVFIAGLVIALVLRAFIVQAFSIPSASMVPTLVQGDRVAVWKLSDSIDDLKRGDVIVFDRPEVPDCVFPASAPPVFIKRVIGLPGEVVTGQGNRVFVDGRELDEPYLPAGTPTEFDEPVEVGPDQVLVMGDNRPDSRDGRCFGPIAEDAIVGRAVARIWPPQRIGGL